MDRFIIRIIIAVLLIQITPTFAQENAEILSSRPKNNIYLNLFGDASIVSINYERLFILSSKIILSPGLGIGYSEEFKLCFGGNCTKPQSVITIPHHLTFNIGTKKSFFEIGIGGTYISGGFIEQYLFYPIAGYRLQPTKSNKIIFRIYGSIPVTGLDTQDILFVPIGISFGISL